MIDKIIRVTRELALCMLWCLIGLSIGRYDHVIEGYYTIFAIVSIVMVGSFLTNVILRKSKIYDGK